MSSIQIDSEEEAVAQSAVQALLAAQRQALASGRQVVFLDNGELVRKEGRGKTVLKKLPPRKTVTVLVKRASK